MLILLVAVAAFLLSLFGAWIFQLLWNWLVPDLFHGPFLSFWKAWGLTILIQLIGGAFKATLTEKK